MGAFVDGILNIDPVLAYALVTCLVFAEDALFLGFLIPGETAAVLGGVIASRGEGQLWLMMVLVILAAVLGDTAGYEIGRHFGPRLLGLKILDRHRARLQKAQDFLRRRGGSAVFLGRFIAFFRAVMPGLAGIARMPYPRFLAFNAAGGVVWGAGFVLLGFLAGNSYEAVANTVGRDLAAAAAVLAVAALVILRVRGVRRERRAADGS
ncbi:MAG: rane-associated protein [Actinomycetota bacterium]|jgi:membrane protein DedA with SNARE-associated domain|nr:rane-associated protein [Actinomycetota bacterium]